MPGSSWHQWHQSGVCVCTRQFWQTLFGSRGRANRRHQGGRWAPPVGARASDGAGVSWRAQRQHHRAQHPSLRARLAHAPSIACPVSRTPGRGAALRAATPTQTCTIRCRRRRGGGGRLTRSRGGWPDRMAHPSATAGHAAENGAGRPHCGWFGRPFRSERRDRERPSPEPLGRRTTTHFCVRTPDEHTPVASASGRVGSPCEQVCAWVMSALVGAVGA